MSHWRIANIYHFVNKSIHGHPFLSHFIIGKLRVARVYTIFVVLLQIWILEARLRVCYVSKNSSFYRKSVIWRAEIFRNKWIRYVILMQSYDKNEATVQWQNYRYQSFIFTENIRIADFCNTMLLLCFYELHFYIKMW